MRSLSQQSGFALIEALVALAILSLCLTELFQVATDSARRSRLAETNRAAELVAQSELAAAGTLYPLDGHTVSGGEGPFVWWVESAPYGDGAKSDVGSLWLVSASVRQRSGGPVIRILRSVRLAPGA